MNKKSDHHVEAFREDGVPGYGWRCFICGAEKAGFRLVAGAESDASHHGIFREEFEDAEFVSATDLDDDVFPEWDAATELADDARRGK